MYFIFYIHRILHINYNYSIVDNSNDDSIYNTNDDDGGNSKEKENITLTAEAIIAMMSLWELIVVLKIFSS